MNLSIFIVFLGLMLLLLFLSYFHDKQNQGNGIIFVRMVAWVMFFLMFVNFLVNGVDYKTGSTMTQTGNETIISTEVYDYTTYSNETMAIFLGLMAGIGFITCFFELRGNSNE